MLKKKFFSYKLMAIASSFTPFPFTEGFNRNALLSDKQGKPALTEFSKRSKEVDAILLLLCSQGGNEDNGPLQ